MNIKELTIKLLLTTDQPYKAIVSEIKKQFPESQSTEKCVAFYAHKIRKADPTALAHRKSSKAKGSSVADLLAKYKQ